VGVRSDNDLHEQTRGDSGGQLSFVLDVQQTLAPVLLTERQVCELLGIGRTTLRSLPLRPKHINRCVRYVASDVERYVAGLT
jgi:predicted DNA-binding transcriptional regulator AlpA